MIRLLFRLWASLMMPILPEIFLSEKSSSSDKPRFVQCTNVNISFTVSVVPSIRGPPGKNKAYILETRVVRVRIRAQLSSRSNQVL